MRTNSNVKLDAGVFSIASTLFGFGETQTKVTYEKTIAVNKIIDPNCHERLFAVYPAIIDKAFAQTMDNYRKHIALYNFKVAQENGLIELHNQAVKTFKETMELSLIQTEFSKVFLRTHATLKPLAYNEKVTAFCSDYGMIVLKQKIQTVKYATEVVFQNLLHLYNAQLIKSNETYIKLAITTPRPLQAFKINSFLVTQLKRNEYQSLPICSKTVRNHRQRLQEAGVLIDYHFAGQNRPVQVYICPDILAVLDLKTSKIITLANIDNQVVSDEKGNVLPDNNENTRTFKNKEKIKENVENISLFNRSSLSLTAFDFFTGTPTSKKEISTGGAGEFFMPIVKPVEAFATLSEKFRDLIIHPQELAENLAEQHYNNYQPIDIRVLYKEAYSGTLTNDEFRELVLQDFFKTASKLWKRSTPYVGSWKKAINLYAENKWIAFTGNAFNKSNVVQDLQELRWRIEWARKWFYKKQFTPLFPFDYFDMSRKTNKEVGFEYTKIKWHEHLQSVKKYEVIKRKQNTNVPVRLDTIRFAKMCDTAIIKFLQHKMTMPQLFEYVEKHLPKSFLDKLPKAIETKVLQLNEKPVVLYNYAQGNLNLKTY
ncbi:hypothetical protein [Flavobacterium sp.]|uniref:hypothetical protein n=1 Tax=Flavobacterium sp. TaxID=239 RepID=UPI0037507AE8